jgi:AbrB family looped-hinge helix DNA binding protein
METTIILGKAGRLVVPKSIREKLGLGEGSRLRLEIAGGTLHAVPQPDPVQIEMEQGFPVIRGTPPMKRGQIVEAVRAERAARDEHLANRRGKP